MSAHSCPMPLNSNQLLEYWIDADSTQATAIEEHLFACGDCSGRLEQLVALADGVKRAVRSGHVGAVLTGAFVERLKRSGLRVREYSLQPSGSVFCTITPQDDLVVAHMHAPLENVTRLDVLFYPTGALAPQRFEDVPFNPANGCITFMPHAAVLRQLGQAKDRMELLAIDASGERLISEYTFNHFPTR